VRLLGGATVLKPGERAWARIVLREAALLLPGDRFIIRMFSPVVTIGGGVVVDTAGIRYRKADRVAERLRVLSEAPLAERIALLVRDSRYGLDMSTLVARTGMLESAIEAAAASAPLLFWKQPQPWFVERGWFESVREKLPGVVREFHQRNLLLPGIPKQDLRGREMPDAPPFLFDALLAQAREIVVEGENVRLASHKLVLKQDEEQARAAIEHAFEQAGLAVPSLPEVLAKSGVEGARARSLLQILLREKRLIRVSDELVFHRAAMEKLRQMLAVHKAARFNVGAFKDWTGVSRKYAIPLLEYLDREHVTRREGDERVVL
jgi:selenocysteine-specific elongation factor